MNFKSRVLGIQHTLNSTFSNDGTPTVIRVLNGLNADLFEVISLWDKVEPYENILERIREERDQLSPLASTEIDIYDYVIKEFDLLLFSK